jgi:hypothetical protein
MPSCMTRPINTAAPGIAAQRGWWRGGPCRATVHGVAGQRPGSWRGCARAVGDECHGAAAGARVVLGSLPLFTSATAPSIAASTATTATPRWESQG